MKRWGSNGKWGNYHYTYEALQSKPQKRREKEGILEGLVSLRKKRMGTIKIQQRERERESERERERERERESFAFDFTNLLVEVLQGHVGRSVGGHALQSDQTASARVRLSSDCG